jgi:hypothetical protein
MSDDAQFDWIQAAKRRGWEAPLRLTLDALEPFGPLGAQLMWTLQPTLSLLFPTEALRGLARTLEDPDGIDQLRRQLDGDDAPSD